MTNVTELSNVLNGVCAMVLNAKHFVVYIYIASHPCRLLFSFVNIFLKADYGRKQLLATTSDRGERTNPTGERSLRLLLSGTPGAENRGSEQTERESFS